MKLKHLPLRILGGAAAAVAGLVAWPFATLLSFPALLLFANAPYIGFADDSSIGGIARTAGIILGAPLAIGVAGWAAIPALFAKLAVDGIAEWQEARDVNQPLLDFLKNFPADKKNTLTKDDIEAFKRIIKNTKDKSLKSELWGHFNAVTTSAECSSGANLKLYQLCHPVTLYTQICHDDLPDSNDVRVNTHTLADLHAHVQACSQDRVYATDPVFKHVLRVDAQNRIRPTRESRTTYKYKIEHGFPEEVQKSINAIHEVLAAARQQNTAQAGSTQRIRQKIGATKQTEHQQDTAKTPKRTSRTGSRIHRRSSSRRHHSATSTPTTPRMSTSGR